MPTVRKRLAKISVHVLKCVLQKGGEAEEVVILNCTDITTVLPVIPYYTCPCISRALSPPSSRGMKPWNLAPINSSSGARTKKVDTSSLKTWTSTPLPSGSTFIDRNGGARLGRDAVTTYEKERASGTVLFCNPLHASHNRFFFKQQFNVLNSSGRGTSVGTCSDFQPPDSTERVSRSTNSVSLGSATEA